MPKANPLQTQIFPLLSAKDSSVVKLRYQTNMVNTISPILKMAGTLGSISYVGYQDRVVACIQRCGC